VYIEAVTAKKQVLIMSKSQQSSTTSVSSKNKDHSGDLSPKVNSSNPKGNGGILGQQPKSSSHGGDKSGDLSPKSGDLSPRGNGNNPKGNGNNPKGNGGLGGQNSGWLGGGDKSGDLSPKSGDLSPRGNGNNPKGNGNNPKGNGGLGGQNSGWLGGGDKSGDLSPKSGDLSPKGNGNNPKGNGGSGNVPSPVPVDRVIMGTACHDTLTGGNTGRDTLVGTPVRGVGERDILIGGNAKDTFVLGDAQGSFYLGQGDADFATIKNFNRCDDVIKLSGSAQDYSISYTGGVASIYQNNGCDLVAKVDAPCSPLDLNGSYFQYVPQACGGTGGGGLG
jgi:hypothetical protein